MSFYDQGRDARITPESFREMCKRHDLTHEYSDDGEVWRRGRAQREAIIAAAKHLHPDVATQIWNEIVDQKMSAEYRAAFYWKA